MTRLEDDSGAQTLAITSDVTHLRRDAIEGIIRDAGNWGWRRAMAEAERPPTPVIHWTDDGIPEINIAQDGADATQEGADDEVHS